MCRRAYLQLREAAIVFQKYYRGHQVGQRKEYGQGPWILGLLHKPCCHVMSCDTSCHVTCLRQDVSYGE